jgi:hypothetical protein
VPNDTADSNLAAAGLPRGPRLKRRYYFEVEAGGRTAGPLLLPGRPGTFEASCPEGDWAVEEVPEPVVLAAEFAGEPRWP